MYKKFTGSVTEYSNLHNLIRGQLSQPSECYLCKAKDRPFDLANLSQRYKEVLSDWAYMCRTCHKRYDSGKYRWDNGWHKRCVNCQEMKSVSEYYQRKSTQKKNGRIYPRIDFTSLCKLCSIAWSRFHKKSKREAKQRLKNLGNNL